MLSAKFLAAALEEFVEAPLPPGLVVSDYAMCRCPACTLEFADPLAPAGDAFYDWLDAKSKYYVEHRWEWDQVEALVAARQDSPAVLEIGAGDARFLRRLGRSAGARTVAIERSAAAVAALRKDSVEAYTPDDAASALANRHFDFVLAFHCLEHVTDPVGLLRTMRGHAGPSGRVLFSVPYSPMYFESRWFDPLNHPPHHLSRWNRTALESLGAQVGAQVRLTMPPAYSLLTRARFALAIRFGGPHWLRRPRQARLAPLRHPLAFVEELARQARRETVDGRAAADVVLVEVS